MVEFSENVDLDELIRIIFSNSFFFFKGRVFLKTPKRGGWGRHPVDRNSYPTSKLKEGFPFFLDDDGEMKKVVGLSGQPRLAVG